MEPLLAELQEQQLQQVPSSASLSPYSHFPTGMFDQTVTNPTLGRNATMDFIVLLIAAGFVTGLVTVGAVHWGRKLFRKYVLKITDPPQSFVMEKKVKCISGQLLVLISPELLDISLQVTT